MTNRLGADRNRCAGGAMRAALLPPVMDAVEIPAPDQAARNAAGPRGPTAKRVAQQRLEVRNTTYRSQR